MSVIVLAAETLFYFRCVRGNQAHNCIMVRVVTWQDTKRDGEKSSAYGRGGGEYGTTWREAGSLHNKQNVFDDFIASAEYLVQAGYTTPARLVTQVSWPAAAFGLDKIYYLVFLLPHPWSCRAV